MRIMVFVVLLLSPVVAACSVEGEQAKVCQRFIPAFERDFESVEILRHEKHGSAENSVVVHYRARDTEGKWDEHWVGCWFEAAAFSSSRLSVVGVNTDRDGLFSPIKLEMLRIWLRTSGTHVRTKGAEPGASGPAVPDFAAAEAYSKATERFAASMRF